MDHQRWLEWRRSGIGSSDAPIIMKVSPWKTPFQLWEEKIHGKAEQTENSAMKRGKDLEETARRAFEKEMGCEVFARNVEHPIHSWMRASLDGICMLQTVAVEIKCPNKDDHLMAVNGLVPQKYIPQVQHQLMVTGLPYLYYYSFDGSKGATVEVMKDISYIFNLFEEERKFWECVQLKISPELQDRDIINRDGDPEWNKVVSEWKTWSDAVKHAQEKEKDAKDNLIKLSNGRSSKGAGVKLSLSQCDGHVDYALAIEEYINSIRKLHPQVHLPEINLENYRKKSFSKWTIRSI